MDLRLPPQTIQTPPLPGTSTAPITITLPAGTTLPQLTTALTLKILQSSGNTATAELPGGQKVTLTSSTPLPTGTLLKLPPQPLTQGSLPPSTATATPTPSPTPLTLKSFIISTPTPSTPPSLNPLTPQSPNPMAQGALPLHIPETLNTSPLAPRILQSLNPSTPQPLNPGAPQTVTLKTPVSIPSGGATLTATAPQTVPTSTPQNPYPAPSQPAVITAPQMPVQPVQVENQPALPVGTPIPVTPSNPQSLSPSIPQSLNPLTPQSPNPSNPQPLNPLTPQALNPSILQTTQTLTLHLPDNIPTFSPTPNTAPGTSVSFASTSQNNALLPQNFAPVTAFAAVISQSYASPETGQTTLILTPQNGLENQTITVTSPIPLPVGSTLEIAQNDTQTGLTLLGLTYPKETQTNQTVSSFSTQWSNLQKALDQLPQETAQRIREKLPNIQSLGTTLAPFIEAVRTGKTKHLTDDETVNVLKSLGIDLTQDIQKLHTLHTPETPENWRGVLFPYIENATDNPRQGGFFWRNKKEESEGKTTTNTRFIVQLNLSQMGPLQLDGLLKYPNLLLKLRTTEPTPESFTEGLQTTVQNLLQSIGLEGGISVETTPKFPTDPLADLTSSTPTTYTTTL